jgi:hypothetical protein
LDSSDLHPTYAVTPPECEPVGVIAAWMWARALKGADGTRPGITQSSIYLKSVFVMPKQLNNILI